MRTTSFAKSLKARLSSSVPLFEGAPNSRDDFDRSAGKAERRESFMVKRQKPQPVLRPGPSLALGTDRAAFNSQWGQERTQADRHTKRIAFIAKRNPSITNRFRNRSH